MGYVKDKYDVTLNQSIWDACISDESDTYYTYNLIPVCITGFTDTSSQCEEEDNYVNYQYFQAITNVSFNREVKNGPDRRPVGLREAEHRKRRRDVRGRHVRRGRFHGAGWRPERRVLDRDCLKNRAKPFFLNSTPWRDDRCGFFFV